jgi:hypothetical protein
MGMDGVGNRPKGKAFAIKITLEGGTNAKEKWEGRGEMDCFLVGRHFI